MSCKGELIFQWGNGTFCCLLSARKLLHKFGFAIITH